MNGDDQDGCGHARTRSIRLAGSRMLAPALLRSRHRAAILLMVHAEQMQYTVQHQDLDLLVKVVAELGRLFGRAVRPKWRSRPQSRWSTLDGKDSTSVG